ncbi:hypothetical protein BOTNAR_0054g00230 [Botryotinia narcissicola]|uniref:Insecticidal crystal toxin domain-containing protein n=1 Tax=Botryotinia narcissicola TaxID=278944 RepID=A0A4Z1J0Z1_9HELO|nr:hypothetical protein BOTNAR_0054g00230 [Botryotinia narcissicola]
MRPLGSIGFSSYGDRNGKIAVLLVGNNPSSTGRAAVASPTGYDQIWRDEKSGGSYYGSFWRPRAPSGSNYFSAKVWDDHKSGAKSDCSVWDIGLPNLGWSEPNNSLAQVLAVPNPKRFTEFTAPAPTFTKNNIPRGGDAFNRIDQCQVTLPFSVYFPPTDAASLGTISNPFCNLTRKIAWYVHTAHNNNSGGQISDSTTFTKGVSKTLSEEMTHSASVSISSSFGVKGFGMDVSLNYQFTLTDSTSFTEYEENSRTQKSTVPPYEATIFLSKRIWIQATRADGSIVLREINFNANEDIHLIGVSLK